MPRCSALLVTWSTYADPVQCADRAEPNSDTCRVHRELADELERDVRLDDDAVAARLGFDRYEDA